MNIYDLRKIISVTIYVIYPDGAIIRYLKGDKLHVLSLTPDELINELISIGSIDENSSYGALNPLELSQWDALNIAIRHELMLEAEKEIDNSDIGKAIDKLKNI